MCDQKTQTEAMAETNEPQMKRYVRKRTENAKYRNKEMPATEHPFHNPVSLYMNMSDTFSFNQPMCAVNLL